MKPATSILFIFAAVPAFAHTATLPHSHEASGVLGGLAMIAVALVLFAGVRRRS